MDHLSKIKAKYIKSLQLKKHRLQENKFIVEGQKSVLEFVHSKFKVAEIIGTELFFSQYPDFPARIKLTIAKESDLVQLGTYKTNNSALAIVEIPVQQTTTLEPNKVVLALDAINDPGNLGTIIRIADWFGLDTLLLGSGSVDLYNPKVITATKGSLTRVTVISCDLVEQLTDYSGAVFAADMQGISLDRVEKLRGGIIILGNESHGIDPRLNTFITQRITIARRGGAESLNVAVAAGIICNALLP